MAEIPALARRGDVVHVGERLPRELDDEVQGQIIAGNFDAGQTGPSGPGYLTFLSSFGFPTDPAAYPLVDITDDGIGGNTAPTVPNNPTLDTTLDPRVVYRQSCHSSYPNDGRSIGGHGHINASILAGIDTRSGAPYQDADGFQRGLGINPWARVGGTRIFSAYNVALCGGTDTGVILANWNTGARISTNSWGCSSCAGSYDESSQAYDVGVRDADLATPGNQQLIYFFSAGNSGSSSGTIGTPGNGKNMITVGASENDRPTWTDGCGIGPTGADNAMDVISFSSRGPAPGNRKKPELIAPGTHIQGTASTHPSYNGSGVCDQWLPSGQTVFAASSGTSHSTPAVAGVGSLTYWWLENTLGMAQPSPALMKAYLMAHPTYLTGVGANDTLPSNSQGYGMPTLGLLFDDAQKFVLDQSEVFDNTGETWTWIGAVADPAKPVRIALAYTDQAGAIGTSPQVNNLNLAAAVDGTTYLGNVFSGRWSVTGGAADPSNNYEAVFLPAGTSGAIQITVSAANVAGDGVPGSGDGTDQDFALVCYNCVQEPTFTLAATPATQAICAPANAVYDVTLDAILGFSEPVTLTTSGYPVGTIDGYSINPVTPPGTSVLTISNTGAASPGSYLLEITGTAASATRSREVGFDLFTATPAAPTPTSPAPGAINQPLRP
ncbi:MAG: S8 family serine peptidase, partial [Thermoanaerobaculia bacterium]|nr:S8 family serine peptidase [Thermoanaerobaculia bacterium]